MSILSSLRKELNKISSIAEDLGKNIKNILRYSEDVSTSSEEAAPTIVKEEKVKSEFLSKDVKLLDFEVRK